MVLSTRDIKAIDPVTGDTVWDEPQTESMSAYDELEFLQDLSNGVARAPEGFDSLGSTPGSVRIFLTYKKRDAIVSALEKRMADLRDQIQRTDR